MWKDLERTDKFIDFVPVVSQHVKTLLTLGATLDSLSVTITPVILEALPLEHRKKFREISKFSVDSACNSLEALLNYIEEEAMLLEECLKPLKKS